MATITIRVKDDEKADVARRAAAAGLDMTAFVRRALDLERDAPDLTQQLEAMDRRLARLEQMAGID